MSKEAMKLALGALEWITQQRTGGMIQRKATEATTAIKQALEQPVQEPVAFFDWYDNAHWGNEDFKEGCHRSWNAAIKYTTPPAAQEIVCSTGLCHYKPAAPVQSLPFGVGGGLVAIKTLLSRDPCVHANIAIEMLDAILKEHPAAQQAPVQEHVEFGIHDKKMMFKVGVQQFTLDYEPDTQDEFNFMREMLIHAFSTFTHGVKTTPPAAERPWVGLTDEERIALVVPNQTQFVVMKVVETKLKEKNT